MSGSVYTPKFGLLGVRVFVGGVLVHLALGSYYMFGVKLSDGLASRRGNYSPYIISYLRNRTDEHDVRNVDGLWVTGFGNLGNTIGMVVGGILDRLYGPRVATLSGSLIFCISVAANYFCVKHSLALVTLAYGFFSNLGNFMAYGPPIQAAIRWLPLRPALATGLIVCGFGGGTLVFSLVVTAFINPHNDSPDLETDNGEKYFTNPDLLDRVPDSFLLLGGIYLTMQLVGVACICDPPNPPDATVLIPNDGNQPLQTNDIEESTETTPMLKSRPKYEKTIMQVIKDSMTVRSFYVIFFTILCTMFGMQFISGVYKAYGQTFIDNDHFLSLSVAISSLFNSIGRPIWGMIRDRFGYKVAVFMICAGFAVVAGTFSFTEHMGKAGFLIWLCLMFFFYSGIWAVMPSTLACIFGVENAAITLGLTSVATAIAAITAGVTGVTLKDQIGWHGLFYMSAGIIALGCVVTFFFNGRDQRGNKI